jgi:hypothetical protein
MSLDEISACSKVFLEDRRIRISSTEVKVDGIGYTLSDVTGEYIQRHGPSDWDKWLYFFGILFLEFLWKINHDEMGDHSPSLDSIVRFGFVILVAIAYFLFFPDNIVMIQISGIEVELLHTREKSYAVRIVSAIPEARQFAASDGG